MFYRVPHGFKCSFYDSLARIQSYTIFAFYVVMNLINRFYEHVNSDDTGI